MKCSTVKIERKYVKLDCIDKNLLCRLIYNLILDLFTLPEMGFKFEGDPEVCIGEFSASEADPLLFFLLLVKAFENELRI